MTLTYLFILSLVQGLTEFLPVSSSAHLALTPLFMKEADQGILIDVALHVGTLCAILVYYWRDVWAIGWDVLRWKPTFNRNLGIYIALATIPALAFGLLIHVLLPDGIRSVTVITATTLIFGGLMGFADLKFPQVKEVKDITLKQALLIGLAQAVALIPGTSRSGITMTTARFLGFKRVDAARFSFLLGIPAMVAAGAMSFLEIFKSDNPGLLHESVIAVGLAFVAGLCAIHFMMKWLKKFGLMPFVVYRILLGTFLLFYFVL
jgi:undecaprenyl-diphosphatase